MPSTRSSIERLLADLCDSLAKVDVRWYVFGAQAAIIYGSNRLTADVDVTVDLSKTSVAELLKALAKRAFLPQIPDRKFVEVTRVIPIVHTKTSIPVDLVIAGPGLEDAFFDRAVTFTIGSREIPFASAEDLIVMKLLSGRPKDHEDIVNILASRGTPPNRAAIRKTLRLAESLLDRSDLVAAFAGLSTRSRPIKLAARLRVRVPRAAQTTARRTVLKRP
jgi:hypothetical protein